MLNLIEMKRWENVLVHTTEGNYMIHKLWKHSVSHHSLVVDDPDVSEHITFRMEKDMSQTRETQEYTINYLPNFTYTKWNSE